MGVLNAGTLDRQLRIERPVPSAAFDGAGAGTWQLVATVWAQVQDALPSRNDKLTAGIDIALRPARVRMRYRNDVLPGMRLVLGARVMKILAGPAELGRREGLELVAGDYSVSGNDA